MRASLVETEHGATLLPTAAIQRNAQGAFVYIIGSDSKASIRTIKVGTTDGSTAAVQGVKPNEVVVVNGFDKLQDGVKVTLHNNPPAGASASNSSSGAAGQ